MTDILGLSLLTLSAYCAGRLVPWPSRLGALERTLFAIALGLAALSWVYAFWGLLGLYQKATILFVLFIPIIAWFWKDRCRELQEAARFLGRADRSFLRRPDSTHPFTFWMLVAVLGLMALMNLSEALLWDNSPDRYHVTNARAFLNAGGFHCFRGLLTASYPMMVETLYLPLFYFSPETVGTLVNTGFGLLTLVALYAFGRRFASARGGLLAATFFYGSTMVTLVSPQAYNDLGLTFYGFMTLYALVLYYESREKFWLRMGAVLAGVAVSTKLLAISYTLAPLILVLIHALLLDRKKPSGAWKEIILLSALIALPYLPWAIKNGLWTGNPLYPFGTSVFSTEASFAEAAERFHGRHQPLSGDLWNYPLEMIKRAYYTAAVEGFTPTILLPIAFVYLLLNRKLRDGAFTLGVLFSLCAFATLVLSSQDRYRFYLPSLPPMAWLCARTMDDLLGRLRSARWMEVFIIAAFAVMTFYFQYLPVGPWHRGHYFQLPPLLPSQREAQLDERDKTRPLVKDLNALLGLHDLLLLEDVHILRFRNLGVPFVPYPYFGPSLREIVTADLESEGQPMEGEAIRDRLRREGVTHLLLSPEAEAFYPSDKKAVRSWEQVTLYEILAASIPSAPGDTEGSTEPR